MAQQTEDKSKRLLEIKGQIDEAKSKSDKLQGTLEILQGQLKQYGCKTLAEAKKKLDQMDADLARAEK